MPSNFGTTPLTTTSLAANQYPVSAGFVPNTASGNLTSIQLGPASTDNNNYTSAPLAIYVPDGNSLVEGATTDAAVTGDVSGSLSAKLRGLSKIFAQLQFDGSNFLKVNVSAGTVSASQSGTWNIANISGTVSLPTGAATDATIAKLNIAQGTALGSNTGPIAQGSVTTGSPTYTTGNINPLSLTTAGALRVDASATTQPISAASLPLPTGAATSAKQPALGTAGSAASDVITVQGIASMTSLKVDGSGVTQPISGTITANAGTNLNTSLLALETGGNLALAKTDLDNIKTYTSAFADTSTSGSVTTDNDAVSIALPGGQATALMQITTSNLNGTLLFEGSPDSGTTYYSSLANQVGTSTVATSVAGTGGSQAAGAWRANVAGFTNFRVRLHPTTSGTATIKIILTQGVHNVAINNATTLGQTTSANSAPVVLPSDYTTPVKSSRLEIAGQSTSIVNGANTDLIPSTDVTGYTMAVLQITGTWSMTLQAQQCNDNANFLQVELINAQTLIAASGLKSTIAANGMFIIPLSGRYLRVRATAWTSNASGVGTLELYTTPPPFVQAAMATYFSLGPQTSGGTLDFHLISAASTNSSNVKNGGGQVYGYEFGNSGASDAWVKFYNKATAPTVGTDGVFRTVYVPKGGRASYLSTTGIAFGTGIGIGVTGGAADNDTTAVAASQVTCEVDYD